MLYSSHESDQTHERHEATGKSVDRGVAQLSWCSRFHSFRAKTRSPDIVYPQVHGLQQYAVIPTVGSSGAYVSRLHAVPPCCCEYGLKNHVGLMAKAGAARVWALYVGERQAAERNVKYDQHVCKPSSSSYVPALSSGGHARARSGVFVSCVPGRCFLRASLTFGLDRRFSSPLLPSEAAVAAAVEPARRRSLPVDRFPA